MTTEPVSQEEPQSVKGPRINKGLVIVNTGNGKGKTTAAMGLLFRAWGRDLKVIMLQFIKHSTANFGEQRGRQKNWRGNARHGRRLHLAVQRPGRVLQTWHGPIGKTAKRS